MSASGSGALLPAEALSRPNFEVANTAKKRGERRNHLALSMWALDHLRGSLIAAGSDPGAEAESAARSAIELRELAQDVSDARPARKRTRFL